MSLKAVLIALLSFVMVKRKTVLNKQRHTQISYSGCPRLPKEPGEHIDVVRSGITPVVYGDTVKRGDFVTADSQGRAVKATSGQAYIGIAEEDGVEDDLGSILVTNGVFTG